MLCHLEDDLVLSIAASPNGQNGLITLICNLYSSMAEYVQQCEASMPSVKSYSMEAAKLTVNGLLEIIEAKGFNRYQFAADGQGSRYWMKRLIEVLNYNEHIEQPSEATAIVSRLEKTWDEKGKEIKDRRASGIVKGRFLDQKV